MVAIVGATPRSLARDARFASKVLAVGMRVRRLARVAARSGTHEVDAFGPLGPAIVPGTPGGPLGDKPP